MRNFITWNAKRVKVFINGRAVYIKLNGRDPYKVYSEVKNILNMREIKQMRLVA